MSDDQSLFETSDTLTIDPNKDYHADLVGEGKKYKTDAELAKAAVFKDAHISRLEREAAEARAKTEDLQNELSTRTRLEALVDNITSNTSKTPSSEEPTRLREQVPSSHLTPTQLEEQIDALLTSREKARLGKTNRDLVKTKLVETYGPNYSNKVREQGSALGLGENFLNNLASENPTAFFKLLGIEAKTPTRSIFSPPVSEINSDATAFSPNASTRNKAYYDKLRVDKGDRYYWSPEVQTQMHKDALTDPQAFGLTNS
jgi:hypothetical protein